MCLCDIRWPLLSVREKQLSMILFFSSSNLSARVMFPPGGAGPPAGLFTGPGPRLASRSGGALPLGWLRGGG